MEHTRTITREFETGERAVLHVEARSGTVAVEAYDGHSVLLEAVVHVWSDTADEADEAAALVARGLEQDSHRVIVRAPSMPQTEGWSLWGGKRGARVDYTARVPVQTAVRVLSRSGRVQVARTHGRVHIESMSGRVSVEDIEGDVTIVSRSGAIGAERVRGNVTAEARSGRIEMQHIAGDVSIEARSGAADVRDVRGKLKVTTHTGSISIEQAQGAVYARAHTGAVRYRGAVRGDFDMRAHTGLIHLAVDPDYPFYVDAQSDVGSVRSDLPPRRAGSAPNGSGPKVQLRTHTGAIRLTRA
jgi:hypothetical protein